MKVPSKQDILNKLLKKAKELYPDNVWVPGLPHTDMAITVPLEEGYRAYLLSFYTFCLATLRGIQFLVDTQSEFASAFKQEFGLTDSEYESMVRADIEARVAPLKLFQGAPSFGKVRLFVQAGLTTLHIPFVESLTFVDSLGQHYRPLVSGVLPVTYDEEKGLYYVDLPVKSVEIGSSTNIKANSIISFETTETALKDAIVFVTNPEAFSGGQDAETLLDFADRIGKWQSLELGVSYFPFVENVLVSLFGSSYIEFRRTGDLYYNRGYGIDVWVIMPETTWLTISYNSNSTPVYPTIEPVIKVDGLYITEQAGFMPERNAYSLSVRQKTNVLSGTVTFNPSVYEAQQFIESLGQTWWLGGTAPLVRMALPVPLRIYVEGKRSPEVSVETLRRRLDTFIREHYKLGATIYYSEIVSALQTMGMEYVLLDTMTITNLITGETPSDGWLTLKFYQYPVLQEGGLVIHEV